MSDDYFNSNDYWDDVYFEELRDEHESNYNSGGIGKKLLSYFCILWGISALISMFS